jgi:crotonobetainyl-CoA:carnitine CoA-transferase CaiB-like acyl-CoA transferase
MIFMEDNRIETENEDEGMSRLPLEGVRIVDLTHWGAGPLATSYLAEAGAEVIKVESPDHVDPIRYIHYDPVPADRPWNQSSWFNFMNLNKLGITLDLTTETGSQLFLELVGKCDLVAENFRGGVMEKFGLGYDELRTVNPRIIMLSMPLYGATGPWRNYRGVGIGCEMIAGLVELSGYEDGPPMKSGIHHADAFEAAMAASAMLTALYHQRRTGKGQHIDSASTEAVTCCLGETLLGYAMNGRVPPRTGNRDPQFAPHGCYPCKGEDKWVTIAVFSDEEWTQLCRVLGQSDLAADERFRTAGARKQNEDALDELVGQWTEGHTHYEIANKLQAEGIAAGPVLNAAEILDDPQLAARDFFKKVAHPEAGEGIYNGVRARLSKTPCSIRRPAPCFGQHNGYVFGELLGLSEGEIAQLEKSGVIATAPRDAGARV